MRPLLGLMAGVVAGVCVTGAVEALGHWAFPPPPGLDIRDPQALALFVEQVPFKAKIAVLVAWGLGVFIGSGVAFRVARGREWPGWVVGFILLAGAGWALLRIPHPAWMILATLILMPAAAYAAARLFLARA